MAGLKTKENDGNVEAFLNSVGNDQRRNDAFSVLKLMKDATGEEPRMWGSSIVGFGRYHHTYASGREGDWMATGFSPRKQSLTLYIMDGFPRHAELMAKLGKHTTGKSCLYIKKLEDIDADVLSDLVRQSVAHVRRRST